MEWWLALLIFLAGVLARVFVPWLIVRYKRPDDPDSKWTWRYIFPQLIAVVVLLLVAPILMDDPEALTEMRPVMVYILGWGTADIGKTIFLDVPNLVRDY